MTSKNRVLSTLLAGLMILSFPACGSSRDVEDASTAHVSQSASSETESQFFPDIEKQDYKGATFCMSGAKEDGSWYLADEYKTGGDNIHVLNNTLYEMNTLVRDKYYDEVLQLRVSEAPDDRDMVEIIYNTVVYDPGMVYAHAGGSATGSLYPLAYTFHNCIGDGKNLTSYCQSYLKSAQKQLNNLVKKVSNR